MIKSVIFDIGGVLAHDVWEHLLLDEEKGIASIFNLDTEQVQKAGQDLWEEFAYRLAVGENGWKTLEESYWSLFIERFNLSESIDYFIQLTNDFIQPVDGMNQLLERLQSERIDLAICSNNNAFWSKRQIDKLGLYRFVDPKKVILSNQIGVSKTSHGFEMFQAVISALGIEKASCIFVDDREENIQRALQFGLAGIIFPSHSKYGAWYLEVLLEKMGVI
jgi:HAD superfamily hydrolase (TIGR01509 family)